MNENTNFFLDLISLVFLFVILGCHMGGPGFGGAGGPGEMKSKSLRSSPPFSVVYEGGYDKTNNPFVRLYYNISHSAIIFYKEDSLYKAVFTLDIIGKKGGRVFINKTTTKSITVKDYSKTISSKESIFGTLRENILVGENNLNIVIRDKNSNRVYKWSRKISVPGTVKTNRQD